MYLQLSPKLLDLYLYATSCPRNQQHSALDTLKKKLQKEFTDPDKHNPQAVVFETFLYEYVVNGEDEFCYYSPKSKVEELKAFAEKWRAQDAHLHKTFTKQITVSGVNVRLHCWPDITLPRQIWSIKCTKDEIHKGRYLNSAETPYTICASGILDFTYLIVRLEECRILDIQTAHVVYPSEEYALLTLQSTIESFFSFLRKENLWDIYIENYTDNA